MRRCLIRMLGPGVARLLLPRPSLFPRPPTPTQQSGSQKTRQSISVAKQRTARERGKGKQPRPHPFRRLPPELTDRGGDGEGAIVAGRVAAPAVPRPRHDPRRRPTGGLLGPAVRAQGLTPRRRRRPRGAAPTDAARVALRAQRSLPGLLPPGTVPFASSAHSTSIFLVPRLMFCSLAVADGRATPGNCRIRLRILFVCCSWRRPRRRTTPRARWSSSSPRLRPQLTRTRGTRRSART